MYTTTSYRLQELIDLYDSHGPTLPHPAMYEYTVPEAQLIQELHPTENSEDYSPIEWIWLFEALCERYKSEIEALAWDITDAYSDSNRDVVVLSFVIRDIKTGDIYSILNRKYVSE